MGLSYAASEANSTLSAGAATIYGSNPNRTRLVIGNPSDTAMVLRFGGAASATAGVPLPAGSTFAWSGDDCPTDSVSLYCAGASKAYTAYQG